jgi:hypothetical protein
LAAGAALSLASRAPWGEVLAGLRERRDQRAALAPIVAEAERAHLTFPEVVVAHPAHAGKAVYWDVVVQSSTSSFAGGRPAWPVVWTNPDRVAAEQIRDDKVLARVAGVKDEVVYLDYLGRP